MQRQLLLLAALLGAPSAGDGGVAGRRLPQHQELPCVCEAGGTGALSAYRAGPCPRGSREVYFAGVNIFDAWWIGSGLQATHTYDAPSGQRRATTYDDALRQLDSAKRSGVKVFRMFASLFGDSQLHWLQNATEYWARMDRLLDAIEDRGLYVLPSIGSSDWYMLANAASAANETKYDLVVNSSSVSRALAAALFRRARGPLRRPARRADVGARQRAQPGV